MNNIFTREMVAASALRARGYDTTKDSILNEARSYATRNRSVCTIFLSHSHHDAELVTDIVILLRKQNIEVYVDWMDESMPLNTCNETAQRIKSKICENQKFIFLATNKSLRSTWCNWEIGYGDSQKYPNNMAIFAVADNDGSWEGNEYLQLYPCITKSDIGDFLSLKYPNDSKTSIKDWFRM